MLKLKIINDNYNNSILTIILMTAFFQNDQYISHDFRFLMTAIVFYSEPHTFSLVQ